MNLAPWQADTRACVGYRHGRLATVAHRESMNNLFFYIGLGLGLAAACGLRPSCRPARRRARLGRSAGGRLPAATSTSCRPAGGCSWSRSCSCSSYAARSCASANERSRGRRRARDRSRRRWRVGALLFAGTLAAHGDAWWPGLIGGAAAAASRPARVRPRDLRRPRAPARSRRARSADDLPRRRCASARRARRRCCTRSATWLLALLAVLLLRTRRARR